MNFTKSLATLAIIAALSFTSCNQKESSKSTASNGAKTEAGTQGMNIRYVDGDTIMEKYNLAKDLNEAMLRRQNQFDAASQQRESEISKYANSVDQKMKSNQYLTEDAYKADMLKGQKMQKDAQEYLGKMQQSIQSEYTQNSQQLQDSISNYLKEYAKQKGYDMVLLKTATLYVDPKFEVTDEVIEGLNKRYTKVSKK